MEAVSRPGVVADVLKPERAGITLLHHAPDLTIIDVVWAPGMRLFPHDHRMWAVIGVYTGSEENEFFRRSTSPTGLLPSSGRTLKGGDVVALGANVIHAVHNPSVKPTGGIHVYGGDFVNQPRSQWRPPDCDEEPYNPGDVAAEFEAANAKWLGS